MSDNKLQSFVIYKIPFIIWEFGKLEMLGLNICATAKCFHLFFYQCLETRAKLFSLLHKKNVRLDVLHEELPVPLQNRETNAEDLAEHKDCLFLQLYNVTPIMKKLSAGKKQT